MPDRFDIPRDVMTSGGRRGIGSLGGGCGGGDVCDEANDLVSSDDTVLRNELSAVAVDVAVDGPRSMSSCVVMPLVAVAAE